MIFRFRFEVLGGHTHLRMFCGPHEQALGKCGDLIMRNEEWIEFRKLLYPAVQIMPEERVYERKTNP